MAIKLIYFYILGWFRSLHVREAQWTKQNDRKKHDFSGTHRGALERFVAKNVFN